MVWTLGVINLWRTYNCYDWAVAGSGSLSFSPSPSSSSWRSSTASKFGNSPSSLTLRSPCSRWLRPPQFLSSFFASQFSSKLTPLCFWCTFVAPEFSPVCPFTPFLCFSLGCQRWPLTGASLPWFFFACGFRCLGSSSCSWVRCRARPI